MNDKPGAALPPRPKIAIIGYSGSGKSTLAQLLSERLSLPVLYVDTIQFLPGWVEREREEKLALMRGFLEANDKTGWIVDGNYSNLEFERRMKEADLIIFLNFNRVDCFIRAYKRSRAYKNKTRPSMTEGCDEKFDGEFKKWLLLEGRSKKRGMRFKETIAKYPEKSVVLKNQRQLDKFKESVL